MSDDETKMGAADRRQVAGDEDYEVEYFAKRHGITQSQAQQLIKQHGNDRRSLDAAAKKLGS